MAHPKEILLAVMRTFGDAVSSLSEEEIYGRMQRAGFTTSEVKVQSALIADDLSIAQVAKKFEMSNGDVLAHVRSCNAKFFLATVGSAS